MTLNVDPNPPGESNTTMFFLGAIFNLVAMMDYPGLIDYGLKAIIGGLIWMLIKIMADFISDKLRGEDRK